MSKTINEWVEDCHFNSKAHGFWDDKTFDESLPEKLMLVVSECSEVLEEHRGRNEMLYFGLDENGIAKKPEGIVPELIDILIRTFDLLGATGYDIETELKRKHDYNVSRSIMHGKKY